MPTVPRSSMNLTQWLTTHEALSQFSHTSWWCNALHGDIFLQVYLECDTDMSMLRINCSSRGDLSTCLHSQTDLFVKRHSEETGFHFVLFLFQLDTLIFSFFTFTVFLYIFRTGWSIIRRIKCSITQAASGTVPSVVDVSCVAVGVRLKM